MFVFQLKSDSLNVAKSDALKSPLMSLPDACAKYFQWVKDGHSFLVAGEHTPEQNQKAAYDLYYNIGYLKDVVKETRSLNEATRNELSKQLDNLRYNLFGSHLLPPINGNRAASRIYEHTGEDVNAASKAEDGIAYIEKLLGDSGMLAGKKDGFMKENAPQVNAPLIIKSVQAAITPSNALSALVLGMYNNLKNGKKDESLSAANALKKKLESTYPEKKRPQEIINVLETIDQITKGINRGNMTAASAPAKVKVFDVLDKFGGAKKTEEPKQKVEEKKVTSKTEKKKEGEQRVASVQKQDEKKTPLVPKQKENEKLAETPKKKKEQPKQEKPEKTSADEPALEQKQKELEELKKLQTGSVFYESMGPKADPNSNTLSGLSLRLKGATRNQDGSWEYGSIKNQDQLSQLVEQKKKEVSEMEQKVQGQKKTGETALKEPTESVLGHKEVKKGEKVTTVVTGKDGKQITAVKNSVDFDYGAKKADELFKGIDESQDPAKWQTVHKISSLYLAVRKGYGMETLTEMLDNIKNDKKLNNETGGITADDILNFFWNGTESRLEALMVGQKVGKQAVTERQAAWWTGNFKKLVGGASTEAKAGKKEEVKANSAEKTDKKGETITTLDELANSDKNVLGALRYREGELRSAEEFARLKEFVGTDLDSDNVLAAIRQFNTAMKKEEEDAKASNKQNQNPAPAANSQEKVDISKVKITDNTGSQENNAPAALTAEEQKALDAQATLKEIRNDFTDRFDPIIRNYVAKKGLNETSIVALINTAENTIYAGGGTAREAKSIPVQEVIDFITEDRIAFLKNSQQ